MNESVAQNCETPMMIDLRALFFASLGEFFKVESDNIASGISERNLCARLSCILERRAREVGLDDFFADVEYNRMQKGKLKLTRNGTEKPIAITCDIILHSRGKFVGEKDNLIAIEMKRDTHSISEKNKDRDRLISLTSSPYDQIYSYDGTVDPEHVCGYNLGIYLELPRSGRIKIEEYVSGVISKISTFEQPYNFT